MSDFIQITVFPQNTDTESKDIVVALLSQYPFNYFDSETELVIANGKTEDISPEMISEIEELLSPFAEKMEWEYHEKQNWNTLWEKNFFNPLQIDEIHIRAPFHPEVTEGIVITIEPRMSFGTGHHATTQLMIQKLLKNRNQIENSKVLDMGAGTGILAIAAEKLGASTVHGIEIDDWVVDNANDNLAINKCLVTTMQHGTANELNSVTDEHFDTVLANIHLEVILTDLIHYVRVLKTNGLLFLSGLQVSDLEKVKEYATSKFPLNLLDEDTLGEWGVLVFKKFLP